MAAPNPTGREMVQLGVSARYTGDRASAPTTNHALQLADSLQSINPQLQQVLVRYGGQLVERQKQKARADALLTSGERFAEAVRSGKLEKTQNPFYIQAYNQEAGQMRARSWLAEMQTQATTWDERNDPVAFQQRWNQQVGQIAEQFKDNTDEMAGFRAEEAQVTQQTIAANTAQNVDRIEKERASNLSAMVSQRIAALKQANGGKVSPEQVNSDLAYLREQVLKTGGTQEEWDRILQSGVTTAAYAQSDPSLLEALKVKGDGQVIAAYDRPGVADAVEADRYRIQQSAEDAARARVNQRAAEVATEGDAAVDKLFETFGADINSGHIDPGKLTEAMRKDGVSERAISYALNNIQRTIADSASLSQAYMTRDPVITQLLVRAKKGDLKPEELAPLVVSGKIDNSDAASLLNAMPAELKTGAAAGAVRNATQLRQAVVNLSSLVATKITEAGGRLSPQARARLMQKLADAAQANLAASPGDFNTALEAARDEAAATIDAEVAKIKARQTSVSTDTKQDTQQKAGANPRK